MRRLLITMMALAAAGIALLASPAPAAAYDYPWCIQGGGWGYPGECAYQTYGQCLASASGRRVYCGINPRIAYGRASRGRAPYPYYPYYPYVYR